MVGTIRTFLVHRGLPSNHPLRDGWGVGKLPAVSTVQEIKDAIQTLSPSELAELEDWLRDNHPPLDLDVDSPELEAELLQAADGPFTPFSPNDLRKECEESVLKRHRE